jgi:aspartyl-tRNA(Asn)/glutamyl-tRNA(Gln) amidotransferase subunit A
LELSGLHSLTAEEAGTLIAGREISPVDLTRAYLDRIDALNDTVHAFIHVMPDALDQARARESEISRGLYRGPLHGVAFAVKDQFDASGAPCLHRGTASDHYNVDATPVARLKQAGAVFLGKLAMTSLHTHDRSILIGTQAPQFPAPRNPWALDRVTGGSSSGPAAAVAAGLCTFSLGEDTAGSIRGPAANCGLVGLMATYGRVSRHGLAPMSWTQDHCGPLTLTVRDAAHVLRAIAGKDAHDATTSARPVPDFEADLRGPIAGAVIGVPRMFIHSDKVGVRPDVLDAFYGALGVIESLGARTVDIDIALLEFTTLLSFVIYASEFYGSTMDEFATLRATSPLYRIARAYLGAATSAADYIRAQRLRMDLVRDFARIFRDVDFIATPAQVATAPHEAPLDDGVDRLTRQMSPKFYAMWNIAGHPALTVPCGFDADGLPIGLQLGGRRFEESALLRLAYAYEQSTNWHRRRPLIVTSEAQS